MKGISVFVRGMLGLYFSLSLVGLISGIGGGDARAFFFFFSLLVLGIATILCVGCLMVTRVREEGMNTVDVVYRVLLLSWVAALTIFYVRGYESVLVYVPKGYVGVTIQDGTIREITTEPGHCLKSPFAVFKTQQSSLGYGVTLPGFTSDGMKVPVLIQASASVSPENLRQLLRVAPKGMALAPVVEHVLAEAEQKRSTLSVCHQRYLLLFLKNLGTNSIAAEFDSDANSTRTIHDMLGPSVSHPSQLLIGYSRKLATRFSSQVVRRESESRKPTCPPWWGVSNKR